MENPAFTEMSLSDGKVIMAIMHVLSLDLLCQAVMGRVPVLECLLLGARVCQRLRPILFGFKCPLLEGPSSRVTCPVPGTPKHGYRGPGCVLSQVSRRS
jgi:hypothetical protein